MNFGDKVYVNVFGTSVLEKWEKFYTWLSEQPGNLPECIITLSN